MKNIGLSVVGSGYIARKVLKDIQGICDIVSVYSRNNEEANRLGERYGAKCCKTYDELLEDDKVDCIYIATPHPSHYPYAFSAIDAGKGVICEKPIVMNHFQLYQLLLASQNKQVYLTEIMWFRFTPIFHKLRDMIESEALGELRTIRANIGFDAYALPRRKRLLDPNVGGGALLDIGVYMLSLVEFIFGDLDDIQYNVEVDFSDVGVDINDKIKIKHRNINCELECSLKRILPTEAVLQFEKGKATIPMFFRPSRIIIENRNQEITTFEEIFTYKFQFSKVFDDIRSGNIESALHTHTSIYSTMCLMDNIREKGNITYEKAIESP